MTPDQISNDGMEHFKNLHRYLLDNGIYMGPSGYEVGFVSSAHTEEQLSHAAEIIIEGLDKIFT
jgi:glutamate-1-semialdehyde 2,1-aminomutase